MSELKQKINQVIQDLEADIQAKLDPDELKTKYLGKSGLVNQLMQILKDLSRSEKAQAGKQLNQLKQDISAKIDTYYQEHSQNQTDWFDLTQPTNKLPGGLHPITQAINDITQIFEQLGFTRVKYPEVDYDWYVFEALNMPASHPARDEWETFFVDMPIHQKLGKVVLTTHTSNGQVREMERLQQPPIRMINIGKCYRRQIDVTHTPMFHQFEGLVVDKNITIENLKGTIDYFAKRFYGPKAKSRIRPFHFQFTEPSFEVDFSCTLCDGKGCNFCKSGWHEVGGAGMVHPNVLKAGGIDPEIYTGFAFGWGIERTFTLKPGLKLDDIRLFFSNKYEFLNQF